MHRDFPRFQDITDTIKHSESSLTRLKLAKFNYSFLQGASLYFLNTVHKSHIMQFELNLSKRAWEEPKKMVNDQSKYRGMYVCVEVLVEFCFLQLIG